MKNNHINQYINYYSVPTTARLGMTKIVMLAVLSGLPFVLGIPLIWPVATLAEDGVKPPLQALPVPFSATELHWALLDSSNHRVIVAPETLQGMGRFVDMGHGQFRASAQASHGKWGYLNEKGQWLVKPTLDDARAFPSDAGIARARRGKRWGYVRSDGTWLVEPRFASARPFFHGHALVAEREGGAFYFMNTQGKKAFDRTFSNARDFGAEGLAPFAEGERWGYVDQRGKTVISPQFTVAFPFNAHGVARVARSSWGEELYGVIDRQGSWVIQPKFEYLWAFNADGIAWGQWNDPSDRHREIEGYLDTHGKLIWEASYHHFSDLVNGLMANHREDFHFYDSRGRQKIATDSKWADDFRDAQVTVALRDVWGLLYRDGRFKPFGPEFREPLVDPARHHVIGFRDGLLAAITQDRTIAYYDRDGKRQLTLSANAAGRMTLATTTGKTLWTGEQPFVRAHAVLAPGPEEHFIDIHVWNGGMPALAERLLAASPRSFYPRDAYGQEENFYEFETAEVYDDYESLDQLPFGAYQLLARSYLDEMFLGYYDYLWQDYPSFNHDYFPALREQLVQVHGAPFAEGGKDQFLLSGDSVEQAVWRLNGRYLILEGGYGVGDGDSSQTLILAAVDPSFFAEEDTSPIPIPALDEAPRIAETSDPRIKQLVRQAAQAVHPAPRDARRYIVEALELVAAGGDISEYDYLWTQYGLLKSSHATNTNNFAHATTEAYQATARRVLAYLDANPTTAEWAFVPENSELNDFKGEVYREAANGLAWMIFEDKDSTQEALEQGRSLAEAAEGYIRGSEDYYILDTKVRLLLRLGRAEAAYRIVYQVLEEAPDFSDFQDFVTDDDYLSWRLSR